MGNTIEQFDGGIGASVGIIAGDRSLDLFAAGFYLIRVNWRFPLCRSPRWLAPSSVRGRALHQTLEVSALVEREGRLEAIARVFQQFGPATGHGVFGGGVEGVGIGLEGNTQRAERFGAHLIENVVTFEEGIEALKPIAGDRERRRKARFGHLFGDDRGRLSLGTFRQSQIVRQNVLREAEGQIALIGIDGPGGHVVLDFILPRRFCRHRAFDPRQVLADHLALGLDLRGGALDLGKAVHVDLSRP